MIVMGTHPDGGAEIRFREIPEWASAIIRRNSPHLRMEDGKWALYASTASYRWQFDTLDEALSLIRRCWAQHSRPSNERMH